MPFDELILTVRIIAISLVSGFAIGLPVTIIATSALYLKPTSRDVWLYSPLVGIGTTVLFCQNLLYLDITVGKSAIVLWCLSVAGWLYVLCSAQSRAILKPAPYFALAAGIAIYLIHAAGLISLGASNYYGYGWIDMFNYVSMAQFFSEHPFHSTLSDQNFLEAAQHFKHDRIGQSVLHAFLMSSSGADAQQTFGATIILTPFLMFFGFLALFLRISPSSKVAYLAAAAGALFPSIATAHLECFLSQALCVPFLILWPVAVGNLTTSPGWRSALCAGLLASVIGAVYTEFVPIILGTILVCAFVSDALTFAQPTLRTTRTPFATCIFWLPVCFVVAVVSNAGFAADGLGILRRTASPSVLTELYPAAYKLEGLARLWLGNQADLPKKWLVVTIAIATIGMFVSNLLFGLWWTATRRSTTVLAALMIMFVPLGPLILGGGSQFGYQFYKLLISVTPLHVFWLVTSAYLFAQVFRPMRWTIVTSGILVGINACLVVSLAYASTKPETIARSGRGGSHLLIGKDFAQLRHFLGGTHDKNVVTLWFDNDLYMGAYRTAWINYFARHNKVISLVPTSSGNPVAGAAPIDERLSATVLRAVEAPLVVSWKKNASLAGNTVLETSSAYVYQLASGSELVSVVADARVTMSRTLDLNAKTDGLDYESWYPIWVVGEPGSASILSIKFNASKGPTEFRYDQWGYPKVEFRYEDDECSKPKMTLFIEILQLDKRMRLTCNGHTIERDMSLATTRFKASGVARFGWNANISKLENKYTLANEFPGTVSEAR